MRVHHRLELFAGSLIRKNALYKKLPVHPAFHKAFRAERRRHFRTQGRTVAVQRMHRRVGIQHLETALPQEGGGKGLARTDGTRDTDLFHTFHYRKFSGHAPGTTPCRAKSGRAR